MPLLSIFRAAWGVVVRRGRSDWLLVAAAWLVVLLATTLLAAGVLYAEAVALSGLRRAVADALPSETNVRVTLLADPEQAPEVAAAVRPPLERLLAATGGELVETARSESWELPGQQSGAAPDLTVFASMDGLAGRVTLVGGGWPADARDPVEVAVSQATADHLALAVGDELPLVSRTAGGERVVVRITGIYAVDDPADAAWWSDALEIEGVSEGSFRTFGPLMVSRAELLGRLTVSRAELGWRVLPNFAALEAEDVATLRREVGGLPERLARELGPRRFFTLDTALGSVLASVDRSLLVSQAGVLLLTVQLAVLAGYALLLVAGLLVEQRAVETALLRSRGAGTAHVAALTAMEGLLLIGPVVGVAPWLASAGLGLFNVSGPLADIGLPISPRVGTGAYLVAGLAGGVALLLLVVPTLVSGLGFAAVRRTLGRQLRLPYAQRVGLDLALLAVAALGLWQLRQYGAPITTTLRGNLGIDPLLVAAPAIGLLAGAVLALRILPRLAQAIELLVVRRRGLVGSIGARQLARRPLRYTRSALLLMLASSLGLFAGAYGATWVQSQRDQADHQVAADLRVGLAGQSDLPPWTRGEALRSLDGVTQAMPIVSSRFDAGGATGAGQLLGIDAALAPELVAFRADQATEPISTLLAPLAEARPALELVMLPDDATHLSVVVTSALEVAEDSPPLPPGWPGMAVSVLLVDGDGLVHAVSGSRVRIGGDAQRSVVALTAADDDGQALEPTRPLRVAAIELGVTLPEETEAAGAIAVVDLAATADLDAGAWQPLAGGAAWRPSSGSGDGAQPGSAVELPVTIEIAEHTLRGPLPGIYRLRAASLDAAAEIPLPVVVNDRFLERTGARLGDTLPIGSLAGRQEVRLVAAVRSFPGTDAVRPVAIADAPSLALAELARDGQPARAAEWWLAAPEAHVEELAATIEAGPYGAASVVTRAGRAEALLTDPVALGTIGALAMGAIAAALLALIGFVVTVVITTRERLGEFALLRALGLSPGQLSGWLSLESTFLLVTGVAAGVGLGLVVAWVVLPFVALTQEASVVVPDVRVVVPWELVAALAGVALATLVLMVVVLGAVIRRLGIGGALRLGDE